MSGTIPASVASPPWWAAPGALSSILYHGNAPAITPTVQQATPVIAATSWGAFVPLDTGSALSWNPVTPGMTQAAEAGLQTQINYSLATINAAGAGMFGTIAGLFDKWGQNQADLSTSLANSLNLVANKSAKACSGFFSCLF